MARVYNFSAGPAVLPEEVLKEAAEEMLDYRGCGMAVMEMSHRSKMFDDIIKTAEADLRELMNIPDNYKVLFLQGGASAQFSAIPLNFMNGSKKADYIITGQWAKKAFAEAKKYGDVVEAASSADKTFTVLFIRNFHQLVIRFLLPMYHHALFPSRLTSANSVWFTSVRKRMLHRQVL